MAELRAFLRLDSTPETPSRWNRWRGLGMVLLLALILIALPEARALLTAGILGGVVLGALLILIRHQPTSGPRRGTPIIVLFPRPISFAEGRT